MLYLTDSFARACLFCSPCRRCQKVLRFFCVLFVISLCKAAPFTNNASYLAKTSIR